MIFAETRAFPERVQQLGEDVWRGTGQPVNQQGLKIVGTPTGTPEYITEAGRQVIESEVQLLEKLPKQARV